MEDQEKKWIVLDNQLTKELDEMYRIYAKNSGLSGAAFRILQDVREGRQLYTQKEICQI